MTTLLPDFNLRAFVYVTAIDAVMKHYDALGMTPTGITETTTELAYFLLNEVQDWADNFFDPETWELSLTEEERIANVVALYMTDHPELLAART